MSLEPSSLKAKVHHAWDRTRNWLRRYCCCCIPFKPKIVPIRSEPVEKVEVIDENRLIIQRISNDFQSKFWSNTLSALADGKSRHAAATIIQKRARGVIGRKRAREHWANAMKDMNTFWKQYKDDQAMQKNRCAFLNIHT